MRGKRQQIWKSFRCRDLDYVHSVDTNSNKEKDRCMLETTAQFYGSAQASVGRTA